MNDAPRRVLEIVSRRGGVMFWQPASCDEAIRMLASSQGLLLAGGTDLFPAHVDLPFAYPLIDLSRLRELGGIEASPTHWRIGAATTWAELIDADLPPAFAGL